MGDTRQRTCKVGDRVAYKNFLDKTVIVDVTSVHDTNGIFDGTDIETGDTLWGYFHQIVANKERPDGIPC